MTDLSTIDDLDAIWRLMEVDLDEDEPVDFGTLILLADDPVGGEVGPPVIVTPAQTSGPFLRRNDGQLFTEVAAQTSGPFLRFRPSDDTAGGER